MSVFRIQLDLQLTRGINLRDRFLGAWCVCCLVGFRLKPTARKVSWLRQRMIEDMTVRNFAPNTQTSYLQQVSLFAKYFGKTPELLGPEEIRTYQIYMAEAKKAVGTRTVAVSALRFLYGITLKRGWTLELIPAPKKDHRLPVILSPEEILRLLQAAPSFPHHVIFSTMYGTGMRVSEAVHLRATDIDSQRMMIRIEQGKGRKDRYVQLSKLFTSYINKIAPKTVKVEVSDLHGAYPIATSLDDKATLSAAKALAKVFGKRQYLCAKVDRFQL